MFLGYNWLVKHSPEVNWNMEVIQFTKCPKSCRIPHQNIIFRNKRVQLMDNQNKEQQEINKRLDLINLEDLPEYI